MSGPGPTRWGIAGAGYISAHFVKALQTVFPLEHKVVAVGARSVDSAKKFADTHGIERYYGSYEVLGQDPDVDVVYVGVVTTTHHLVAAQLLNLGKHVLIEKPLTLNSHLSRDLCSLAKSKNLFLMEAIWSRFLASFKFAKEQIASGVIGDVLNVSATMCVSFPEGHNISNAAVGGGSIYAVGVYPINGVTFLAYPGLKPEVIQSSGVVKEDGADLAACCIMKFPDGKMATINTDLRVKGENDLIISGTAGQLKLHAPFWCAERVTINGVTLEFPIFGKQTSDVAGYDSYLGLAFQAQEIRQCLAVGKIESDILPHADSILISEIEDSMRQAVNNY